MNTRMKKLISIGTIPVLALALLVVLGTVLATGSAPAPVSGSLYLAQADDTETDSTVKKLQGTISLYLTEEKVDVEADIAAIEELLDNYGLAMETGDLDLWMSFYTDDIVKMGPGGPAIYGKEDLRAMMKPLFDNFTFGELACSDVEIQVAGRWAFIRLNFTQTMTPKAGGEPLYMDAKDLCIYKRQADGSWKAYIDCFNSNVPPTVE